mmetsp:Transcript_1366/g.2184  ORF Transcript_1366/g.2184 Transcript_1366/m.2184 type:complete len:101 (-) Transcript_1366:1899-2201(-)
MTRQKDLNELFSKQQLNTEHVTKKGDFFAPQLIFLNSSKVLSINGASRHLSMPTIAKQPSLFFPSEALIPFEMNVSRYHGEVSIDREMKTRENKPGHVFS